MKLPAFESLDEKMNEMAEKLCVFTWSTHEQDDYRKEYFEQGFNAGVIERDLQWQSKVGKLIEALEWYAKPNSKTSRHSEFDGLAKSALAEFYGENEK